MKSASILKTAIFAAGFSAFTLIGNAPAQVVGFTTAPVAGPPTAAPIQPTNTGDLVLAGASTLSSFSGGPSQPFGGNVSFVNDGIVTNGQDDSIDTFDPQDAGPGDGGTNAVLTFNLNTSVNTLGYNITQIEGLESYVGGREVQSYNVAYSLVGSPSVFIPLVTVHEADFVGSGSANETEALIGNGAGGTATTPLASGVADLQFTFTENADGISQIVQEIDVFGSATVAAPEPSTYALVVLGVAVLMIRLRRKGTSFSA